MVLHEVLEELEVLQLLLWHVVDGELEVLHVLGWPFVELVVPDNQKLSEMPVVEQVLEEPSLEVPSLEEPSLEGMLQGSLQEKLLEVQ